MQVIPHVTDAIKEFVVDVKTMEVDFVLVEIGGTVGDIEGFAVSSKRSGNLTTTFRVDIVDIRPPNAGALHTLGW